MFFYVVLDFYVTTQEADAFPFGALGFPRSKGYQATRGQGMKSRSPSRESLLHTGRSHCSVL